MTDAARLPISRRVAPLAAGCAMALLLAACGSGSNSSTTSATATATAAPSSTIAGDASPAPSGAPITPLVARLPTWSSDLHSLPVSIPLRFQAPTIGVDIAMEAVGLTPKNDMDAPEGSPDDPNWNLGFWYRGGVEPGQPGVATIAGHLDDTLGRPAAFWNLRKLVTGDVVQVVDTRTGEVIHFKVTEARVYSNSEASTRPVLTRLFGAEAALAQPPTTFPQDGISRISLVTCAGVFTRGEYDHRYIVYAERVDGRGSAATPATPSPTPAAAATGTSTAGSATTSTR
jgi:hypothetical protein